MEMKDSIDFGAMNISKLFRKLLIPTVLGMVFSAIFVITDGIFVGKGVGSDALAAVNITAPLFMITTGIGLMFGVGASVVIARETKSCRYQHHAGACFFIVTDIPAICLLLLPDRACRQIIGKFGPAVTVGCRIYELVCPISRILPVAQCRNVLCPS